MCVCIRRLRLGIIVVVVVDVVAAAVSVWMCAPDAGAERQVLEDRLAIRVRTAGG